MGEDFHPERQLRAEAGEALSSSAWSGELAEGACACACGRCSLGSLKEGEGLNLGNAE